MVASAGAALSQAQRPSDSPAAPQSGATNEERGTRTRPFVVEIPSTEESRRQAHEQSEREDKAADRELSLVNWTKSLTAVTGLLVLFTGGLWLATRRLVADARRSSERGLRAYIAVYPMGVAQLIGTTEALGQVRVQNVGQTPARDVTVIVHAALGARERNDFPIGNADKSDRSIQPSADLRQGSRDRLDVGKIMSRASTYIFVWGEVRYRDIDGVPRFTRFRHRYHAGSRNKDFVWQTRPKKTRWIIDADKARYHTSGNDSD